VPRDKKSHISKLKGLLKDADELYLATDEDREGEAIAWHLLDELKPKDIPVQADGLPRDHQAAILAAAENPRELDMDLVEAQEARRILDRLYRLRGLAPCCGRRSCPACPPVGVPGPVGDPDWSSTSRARADAASGLACVLGPRGHLRRPAR
jgi:hypothetical protein